MRKGRLVLALLFAVMLGTVGIGVAQDAAPAVTPVACDEPGELTMWVWDENWATIIGQAIDEWVADYCPGATVDLQVQPWANYWDLLRTNVAGGDMPDVFNMSQTNVGFYQENEALLDLQPYLDAAGIDTSVWGSGMIDPYRGGENGDLYALPVNWDTIAVYYNKDLFDAAGLEYPTAEWTWDDFAADAEALTDAAAGVYGAAAYSEYQAGWPNWVAATGIAPVIASDHTTCTLQDAGSIEGLTFLKGLLDAGYMPTISDLGGTSADDAFNAWLAGRVAMVTGGSWKLPAALESADFNWDVVQLPRNPETGRSRSIVHSVGYVGAASTDTPDLAANLIIFLGSDAGQRYFAEAGGVAPAAPSQQQTWIDAFGTDEVNIQTFVDALQDSQGVTVFDEIWNIGNTELPVNIFDLGMSVEEATALGCEAVDAAVAGM